MSKSNRGSSMPNQGDRRSTKGAGGANVRYGTKSKGIDNRFKVHKGRGRNASGPGNPV